MGGRVLRQPRAMAIVFRWTNAGPEDVEIGEHHQEFSDGPETSADSSRRNPAGGISRSTQADAIRSRGRAACATHPIERIAHEEKPATADTALRLGKFFKTGAAFWMNIQAR